VGTTLQQAPFQNDTNAVRQCPDLPEQAEGVPERRALQQAVAEAFRPIIRGSMLPVAIFFALVIIPNFFFSAPWNAVKLSILSAATVCAALFFRRLLRAREVSFRRLELSGAVMLLLVYANFCNVLYVDFHAPNLTYFLLLFTITAAMAISVRLIVAVSMLTLATTLGAAYLMGPLTLSYYCFASMAAAFAAGGMAVMTRGAIMRAARARLLAERLRERAQIQADYDSLTGLPNRRHFFSALEAAIGAGGAVHVGVIDLDGFKPVNDLYGHAIGDELLIDVAKRIRAVCPQGDLVARLGGDEFSLSIERPLDNGALTALGNEICERLRDPFLISGICVSISASIGFANYPAHAQTLRQIYERADHALYRAKRDCRGHVMLFRPEYEAEMRDLGRLEQTLRTADLPRELFVVYQPQHDLMTGQTAGFEALARWKSPVLGNVSPGDFIPAAERSGLIERMTGIVLQKALAAAATWPAHISLSVNLSGLDLVSERSIANIVHIVRGSGIDPQRLTFEITETAMMDDFDRARASLATLAALGSRIALDDFGSGYSSFAYIHRFPLHRIKTDRSFVTRLHEDEAIGRNIVRAIAELCANLGVECLAEGIETEDELRAVRETGVRYIQGYYFGRPMQAFEVEAHLSGQPGAMPKAG